MGQSAKCCSSPRLALRDDGCTTIFFTTLEVEEAAIEIRRARDAAEQSPFFFLVGAGISHPSIPLSSKITQDCAAKYEADRGRFPGLRPPRLSSRESGVDAYSHFFELAYPQPFQRAEYLNGIIHGKPITGATLRLAHLLASSKLTQLVVTPNFDDHLQRALNLFGESFIVCDHPLTTARIDPDRRDVIQLVHVHGTYWFYDCCNLKYELAAQAREADDEFSSMPMLLSQILSKRSPIVVGYSGWENDLIMGTLRRKLAERIPYNLYWFCYSKDDYARLPPWLQMHQNVRFIVPATEALRDETSLGAQDHDARDDGPVVASVASEPSYITAQKVFDTLIQVFELQEPRLTADPLAFLASRLRSEAAIGDIPGGLFAQDVTVDLYDFASVIERIDRASDLERAVVPDVEAFIEELRSAIRRSDYDGVLKLVTDRQVDHAQLTATQREAYAFALEAAAQNLSGDNEEIKAAWSLAIGAREYLHNEYPSDANLLKLAHDRVDYYEVIESMGESQEAESGLSSVINDKALRSVPGSGVVRIRALVSLASSKRFAGDYAAATPLYAEARAGEFAACLTDEIQIHLMEALRGGALNAFDAGDISMAQSVFQRLLELFATSPDPVMRRQVAWAIRDQVRALNEKHLYDEAIDVSLVGEALALEERDDQIRDLFVLVRSHYAFSLLNIGEYVSALRISEEVIHRYRVRSFSIFGGMEVAQVYFVAISVLKHFDRLREARILLAESDEIWRTRRAVPGAKALLDRTRVLLSD